MAGERYSRQEAIALSGSTSSRLSYLDRVGLVQPEKIGGGTGKKPAVLYTAAQIESIQLINQAAAFLHTEAIQLAVQRQCLGEVVETVGKFLG